MLHVTGPTGISSVNSMNSIALSEGNSEMGEAQYVQNQNENEMSLGGISSVGSVSNYQSNVSDVSSIQSFKLSKKKQSRFQPKSNTKSKFFQQKAKDDDSEDSEEGDFESYDENDLAQHHVPNVKMVDEKEDDEEDHVLKQANLLKQT